MIPAAFEYIRPKTLDEAFTLVERNSDAKFLAGGHSLIPMMKLRLAAPELLIDLRAIPSLAGIHRDAARLRIGALTTHSEMAASGELQRFAPALWDAANGLGDPQVRNRGTIGGACAHGDPSADYPACMLALDAVFTVRGKKGEREIKADDFFVGMFETALDRTEILTAISFAVAAHSAYVKFEHPASHYALVGAAVKLDLAGGNIGAARVALTGVGDSAAHAGAVEKALAGCKTSDADALKAACARAAEGFDVRADIQASVAYRSAMADVFTLRAVTLAISRT